MYLDYWHSLASKQNFQWGFSFQKLILNKKENYKMILSFKTVMALCKVSILYLKVWFIHFYAL